jgi:hypothetical protein
MKQNKTALDDDRQLGMGGRERERERKRERERGQSAAVLDKGRKPSILDIPASRRNDNVGITIVQ